MAFPIIPFLGLLGGLAKTGAAAGQAIKQKRQQQEQPPVIQQPPTVPAQAGQGLGATAGLALDPTSLLALMSNGMGTIPTRFGQSNVYQTQQAPMFQMQQPQTQQVQQAPEFTNMRGRYG